MNQYQDIVDIFINQFIHTEQIGLTEIETISFQGLKQRI